MTRILLAATALGLGVAPALAEGPAPKPMTFSSKKIELPQSERMFPGGPEAEAVNNNCLACHSAGMVLTQPKLSKAQWTETVNKMVKVYHATVSPEDVGAIVDYLANLKPQP
ncbi:cytochrome c [Methylobacterium sp. DB1607]|nr:cytochrome c [Methylobacterium sp. DB1607]